MWRNWVASVGVGILTAFNIGSWGFFVNLTYKFIRDQLN